MSIIIIVSRLSLTHLFVGYEHYWGNASGTSRFRFTWGLDAPKAARGAGLARRHCGKHDEICAYITHYITLHGIHSTSHCVLYYPIQPNGDRDRRCGLRRPEEAGSPPPLHPFQSNFKKVAVIGAGINLRACSQLPHVWFWVPPRKILQSPPPLHRG